MQVEAVDDRAHRVLADAEVQVAPAVGAPLDAVGVLDQRQRGGRQVGRSAHQLGHALRRPLDDLVGGLAGGHHPGVDGEARHLVVPALGPAPGEQALDADEVKFLGSYPVAGDDGHVRRKAVTKAWRDANTWLDGLRDQIRHEDLA